MRVVAAIAVLAVVGHAIAQTNVPTADYGAGFVKLYEFGLPDVSGGVYGSLRGMATDRFCDEFDRLCEFAGIEGKAWRIRDLGGGTNRYVRSDARVVDIMDFERFMQEISRIRDEVVRNPTNRLPESGPWTLPGFAVADWSPLDIRKDTSRLLAKLDEVSRNSEVSSLGGTGRRVHRLPMLDYSFRGRLLLHAAQLYRCGLTNEANRLAERLFEERSSAREVMGSAIAVMAAEQYRQGYEMFLRTRDWGAWHRALTELVNRFSVAWTPAKGVALLAECVKKQADRVEPPPLTGNGLDDEDRQLARRLAFEPREAGSSSSHTEESLWLFKRPEPCRSCGRTATSDVIADIRVRRRKSVPLLIAMLGDTTITPPEIRAEDVSDWQRRLSRNPTPDQVFDAIDRPRTRGELAKKLLWPVVILGERSYGEVRDMTLDKFRAECRVWHEKHKDMPDDRLALEYLEEGSVEQKILAVSYLVENRGPDADFSDVEALLLPMAKSAVDFRPSGVHTYVRMRRDKATGFVERVASAILVTNRVAGTGPAAREQAHRDYADRLFQVNEWRRIASVRTLPDLLERYLSEKRPAGDLEIDIRRQISRQCDVDPGETVRAVLAAIGRTETPEKRTALLEWLCVLKNYLLTCRCVPNTGGERRTAKDCTLATHATLWKSLLADGRGKEWPVRAAAAWTIEVVYGDEEERTRGWSPVPWVCLSLDEQWKESISEVVRFFGEEGVQLLVNRAHAYIDGRAIPELPRSNTVKGDDLAKLLAKVEASDDVVAALTGCSMNEQLAVAASGPTNKALNAKLRLVADRITRVDVSPEFEAAEELDVTLKGRKFGLETVSMLKDLSLRLGRDGHAFNLTMYRLPNLRGMAVVLAPATEGDLCRNVDWRASNEAEVAIVSGWVFGGGRRAEAWWLTGKGSDVTDSAAEPTAGVASTWGGSEPAVSSAEGAQASSRSARPGFASRVADKVESEMRDLASRRRKDAQDKFWKELDLIVDNAGAYAATGVRFQGQGRPVSAHAPNAVGLGGANR